MASDAEIRQWARDNDVQVAQRGRLAPDVRAEYDAAHPIDEQDDGEAPLVVELPDTPAAAPPAADEPKPDTPKREEIRPKGRKVTAADRFRQRIAQQPKGKPHRRVSLEDLVGGAWGLAGLALTRNMATVPLGRVLAAQAPVAGIIVEDVAKGTVIDKVLQPIARMGDSGKTVAALLGPPVLVGLITARPELAAAARPVLKATMMSWMEIAGPAVEKAQKRAAKWTEQFGDIDLDAIIDSFWSTDGLPPVGDVSPEEEEAIRRARGNGRG